MIAIFDYGAGNLRSVANTLEAVGARYEIVRDTEGLRRAQKIILPGVGHFGQIMRALETLGVRGVLVERIRSGVPFLGICLGLQVLFQASEEAPELAGLGLFPETVRRFRASTRVPHMGWNRLERLRPCRLLKNLPEAPFVYFAHSYYVPVTGATAAVTHYTLPYTSLLEQDNVFGVQFHPEKSGPVGLAVIRNFVELAPC